MMRLSALALLLAGCGIDDLPFRCDQDSSCVLGGEHGVCEANGYCSFSDSSCDGIKRRYGDNAPSEVAGRCVPSCVSSLALGQFHSCALLASGSLRCWGDARDGQLGNGKSAIESYASPVAVDPVVEPVAHVSAGEDHTCAVKSPEGTVWCWGSNQGLQLGVGSASGPGPIEVPLATPLQQPAIAVAAGIAHSCSLGSWGAKCWGFCKSGQLGSTVPCPSDPKKPPALIPVAVAWNADILEIGVGAAHTCARPSVGAARCWGDNSFGQVAGKPGPSEPLPVEAPVAAQHIAVGAGHTCALMDGKVGCWGNNEQGQLGPAPGSALALDADAKAVSAGYAHNCVILGDGRITCWGSNLYGQLGPNAEAGVKPSPPVIVPLDEPAQKIFAGREHSCAIGESGRVYCWGRNEHGQLGNGESGSSEPSPTPDPSVWKKLCD